MQRLNRLRDDRGAVAVWVALLLVPLLIVAALAVDLGAVQADRQRLQTGADAAALGVAQHCAEGGECSAASARAIADELAIANDPLRGTATVTDFVFEPDEAWVEVQTTSTSRHWFAPVIGEADSTVVARGAASWVGELPDNLPLAFSFCALQAVTGATVITSDSGRVGLDIVAPTGETSLSAKGNTAHEGAVADCQSDRGWSAAPGNFGWLDVADNDCFGALDWTSPGVVTGDPGVSPTSECRDEAAAFADIIDRSSPLLVPIYSHTTGTGNNVKFHIVGYAVVELEGIAFPGLGSISASCDKTCVDVRILDWIDADEDWRPVADPVVSLRLPGARP